MTIGIDISQVVYEGTGVANYTENLVRNLLNEDSKNQYILFGSSLRRKNQLFLFLRSLDFKSSVKSRFFNLPPKLLEILWNQIHWYPIEKMIGKVDVFHTSDWTEPPSLCHKVTTIHDLVVLKFPNETHPRIKKAQIERLKWVKRESKKIIADSSATKSDIIELLQIPEDKITVIHLAPRPEFRKENFVLKDESIKEKFELKKPYFLSVGTREPRKNLKRLVSAFHNFNKNQEVDLAIAGNFGWGDDIKPINGVKILGFVPNDELAALYERAMAFVFPSLYEGFGLPVLEAQSMGCPVISSDRGSLREILPSSAIKIDPEKEQNISQALEYMYSLYESEKYFQMIKDGLEFSKQFSWEKTAQETLRVYQEVTSQES